VHELADGRGADPLGGGVDWGYPTRVHRFPLVAVQHLDLLVRQLEASAVHGGLAGDRQLHTLPIRARDPWLVEENEVEGARAVVHLHRNDRLPSSGHALVDYLDPS